MMTFLEELQWRGLVKDVTDLTGLIERLKTPVSAYCGFDPTADSLHVGHLQQILLLKRYQLNGHRPIAVCGGATGMIGDPRPTTERRLLSLEDLNHNVECLKKQLARFLNFDQENGAILLNNYDWLGKISILEFLRDYGKHFNVNYMINKDIVASRLNSGISFTEFTYTILQAADWLHLYQNFHCELQIGGSDQWGNLTSGAELIRKVVGDKAKVYGITSPLITKSDGSKFGKSEGVNIWLNDELTSPYEFYQFWLNIPDSDVITMLKRLSFKTPDEITLLEVEMQNEAHLRKAQKSLAEELTILVHGQEGFDSAIKITDTLFGGNIKDLSLVELKQALVHAPGADIDDKQSLVDVLISANIASSKREAREWISNGSISVNGDKVVDSEFIVEKSAAFGQECTIIKRGKKNYYVCRYAK